MFDGAWLANEKAPLPGPFSVERIGIEPATSGLQRRRDTSLGATWRDETA